MQIDARLWVPNEVWVNLMLPVPNKVLVSVPIVAFLTNESDEVATVAASTPCDVHYWEVRADGGNIVQAEPPEAICAYQYVLRELKPGETLRGDNTLLLNGKLLADGAEYSVHYKFFGHAAIGRFVAHHAV